MPEPVIVGTRSAELRIGIRQHILPNQRHRRVTTLRMAGEVLGHMREILELADLDTIADSSNPEAIGLALEKSRLGGMVSERGIGPQSGRLPLRDHCKVLQQREIWGRRILPTQPCEVVTLREI